MYIKSLLLILALSTLLVAEEVSAEKRIFSQGNISIFCAMIKSLDKEDIAGQMDVLIKQGGITKEQWNTKYAFSVNCLGAFPIVYALSKDLEKFKVLADYGVSLDYPFKDDERNITTLKDYVRHKIKIVDSSDKSKFKRIYKILRDKGAKGCKQQPELKCTATYIK